MTTVLDEPTTQTNPAQRLRTTMAGVRLSVTSLGTRKTLTPQQKAQAADTFGIEGALANPPAAGNCSEMLSHPTA